jgi:predicted metal-binding protein
MRQIILCTTCRYSADSKTGPDGRTGGETLVAHVRARLLESGLMDVEIQTQACLWNCNRPCSVILRDNTRFSYVTGGHEPTADQAAAILQWFALHGQSESGEVPFRQWPDRMRGHFIARMPKTES